MLGRERTGLRVFIWLSLENKTACFYRKDPIRGNPEDAGKRAKNDGVYP
jgi:hypothetical protein